MLRLFQNTRSFKLMNCWKIQNEHYKVKVLYLVWNGKFPLPLVHGVMGCGQKSFKLVWRCHQLLSGFLIKGHSARVLRRSRMSANDRMIMRWYRGLCTDLLGFTLKLRKTSARWPSMKAGHFKRFSQQPMAPWTTGSFNYNYEIYKCQM